MGFRAAWGSSDDQEKAFSHHEEEQSQALSEGRHVEAVIERGADDLVRQIAPTSVIFDEQHFRLGDYWCRVIYLDNWPIDVPPNWLRDIFQWPRAMDVTIFYEPMPTKPLLSKLRGKSARLQAQIEQDEMAGEVPDNEMYQEWEDANELLNLLQRGESKPFSVSLQLMIRATSLRELNELTEQIEKTFDAAGASVRAAELRQRDAFLSVLPFGRNYIKDGYTTRNMHTQAAMYSFPLANADLSHPSGIWYGINRMTNSNVILDRFRLQSPHSIVLGASGSGKSYGSKLEQIRVLMRNMRVIVIDPEAECERLAAMVGGQFITIGPNSPDRINCMDFSAIGDGMEDHLTPKILSVLKLVGSMMNPGGDGYGMNAEQVQLLEMLMRSMYSEFGYTQDPRTQLPPAAGGYCTRERMPILSDFRARITRYLEDNEHDERVQMLLRPVIAAMGPYCAGGMFSSLFDERTTVDLRSQYVVFNIKPLVRDEHLMALGMHTVLDYVWNSVMSKEQSISGRPVFLYIDEAQIMMRSPESAQFMEDMVRRARKFNCALTILTQSPEDFIRPDRPQGRAIFDNSSMQVIMRLKLRALQLLQDLLGLDDNEVGLLANAQTGEGMIFVMNDRVWISMRTASPREHMMITTDPQEVAAIEAMRRRELESASALQELPPEVPQLGTPGRPHLPAGAEFEPRSSRTPPPAPRRPTIGQPEAISQIGGHRNAPSGLRRGGPPRPVQDAPQPQPPAPRQWNQSPQAPDPNAPVGDRGRRRPPSQ